MLESIVSSFSRSFLFCHSFIHSYRMFCALYLRLSIFLCKKREKIHSHIFYCRCYLRLIVTAHRIISLFEKTKTMIRQSSVHCRFLYKKIYCECVKIESMNFLVSFFIIFLFYSFSQLYYLVSIVFFYFYSFQIFLFILLCCL